MGNKTIKRGREIGEIQRERQRERKGMREREIKGKREMVVVRK